MKLRFSNAEEQRQTMLTRPIGRLLFFESFPTILIQLITVIYNTADTYFVAKISTAASAAVGVVFSLMALIQAIGFGIGMGANSLISRTLGAKRENDAARYGSSAVAAGILMGVLILTVGICFLPETLELFGARRTFLSYAKDYATFIFIGAPFMCFASVLNCILRAEGQTFFSMIGMTSGGILNLILDPILIFSLDLGIKGASLATMISQIVSAGILLSLFLRGKTIVKLGTKFISRRLSDYAQIAKMGLPTVFRQGLSSLSTAVLNMQAVAMGGDAAVAAVSVANKIYLFVRHIILGIGHGYQPISGYCYGAGNKQRVRQVFRIACFAGTAAATLFGAVLYIFSPSVIAWFRDDSDMIRIGGEMLRFLCFAMPTMAFSTYVNLTYQSLGFSVGATILASCRQGICFLPFAYLLPRWFGLAGIETVQTAADVLTFLVSIPFWIFFVRRYLKEGKT